ncbi:glycoside hydrolase family 16 protein [Pedobacter terrae]|uniref:glycoside hydrolase family 16 protein n=1 Tax=Pedobacter terrae TaxID=405671 RepID=UPI002FFA737B
MIVLLTAVIHAIYVNAQNHQNGKDTQYKLIWSEEFNTSGTPDTTVWQYERGFVRQHELQWYTPENAYCKNGRLIIEARQVHRSNPNYQPESNDWRKNRPFIEYTSASLNTRHSKSFLYGRIVMRARIDTAAGLWPAFWTLGIKGEWPSNGEIDIMEYYRGKLLANIAHGTSRRWTPRWYSKTTSISDLRQSNWYKKFHIWRMDWDVKAISLYIDDKLLNRVELKVLVNQDGSDINPYNQPHYLLVNLALGGDNGGDPSQTSFPRRYEIDYIRVYKK